MPSPARIVFLGTGGALNPERYQASILIETVAGRLLLDTGGGLGIVRRLQAAGVDLLDIGHLALSHRHLDHAGGLEPFLLSFRLTARRRGVDVPSLRLYALAETAEAVRAILAAADAAGERLLGDRLAWVTPKPAIATPLAAGLTLTLVPVEHPPPGGGAAACVVTAGEARIVYSGDTGPVSALVDVVRGAALLIHEASGLDERADRIHASGHSTAGDVGRLVAAAGIRTVALTHVPPAADAEPAALVAEVRRFAPDARVLVAEDGLVHAL